MDTRTVKSLVDVEQCVIRLPHRPGTGCESLYSRGDQRPWPVHLWIDRWRQSELRGL